MKIYQQKDNSYRVERSSSSYYRRQELKSIGAKWNGSSWILTEEQANKLNNVTIFKRVLLKPYCHTVEESERISFASPEEIKQNKVKCEFCGKCDSRSYDIEIEKILELNK